ncbi:hypothetical protein I6F66_04770 [Pseudoalteromonas sp. NZS100_1]|uniref:hypothetical protein n=1 Tax=Pseudoalteromonas sp. NZS100_1 TaxID=2792073 RepID=UPI0018CDA591|nr:hypothetical protein [Pseudoalteromonas sp. NZS100_1]MBH0011388.1 hypothetical protein [Pseudoalteromonas sp. NZS100_1]
MTDIDKKKVCGIVMPISSTDDCNETHWSEVLNILSDAIDEAGFEGNLVSNADDVGIIHKRIIQNLYDNPIVVCDVSCKNPNVMFELGLRLAFDKPTIIIKDDETSYSFDTSAIEHLEYPRDLRFSQVVEFKKKLADKISATYKKSTTDSNYTTFLKHFGEFKVAKIDQKEVSGQEYILEELKTLRRSINRLDRSGGFSKYERNNQDSDIDICLGHRDSSDIKAYVSTLVDHPGLKNVGMVEVSDEHYHLVANVKNDFSVEAAQDAIESLVGKKMMRNRTKNTSVRGKLHGTPRI